MESPALRQFHSASGAFWIHNSWARNRLKLCDFGLWLDCILGWHSWWISALVPWQTTNIWQISARHGMFRDVQRRLGTAKFMYFVITYDYPINSELEFRIVFFPVRSISFQSSSQLGAVHPFHALRSTTFEPGSSAKSVVAVWSCLRLVTSRITEYFSHWGRKNPSPISTWGVYIHLFWTLLMWFFTEPACGLWQRLAVRGKPLRGRVGSVTHIAPEVLTSNLDTEGMSLWSAFLYKIPPVIV